MSWDTLRRQDDVTEHSRTHRRSVFAVKADGFYFPTERPSWKVNTDFVNVLLDVTITNYRVHCIFIFQLLRWFEPPLI